MCQYLTFFLIQIQLRSKTHEADKAEDDSEDRIEELKLSLSNESSSNETALLDGNNKNDSNNSPAKVVPAPGSAPNDEAGQETSTNPNVANNPVQKSPSTTTAHSRQSSQASTTSTSEIKVRFFTPASKIKKNCLKKLFTNIL